MVVPAVLEPVITVGAVAAGAAADIVTLEVDGIFGDEVRRWRLILMPTWSAGSVNESRNIT